MVNELMAKKPKELRGRLLFSGASAVEEEGVNNTNGEERHAKPLMEITDYKLALQL